MNDIKLNYDDVALIPERITSISSRSQCNPYDDDGYLPIFASCMTSVVSFENVKDFNAAKIHTVIPRSYSVEKRVAYLQKHDKINFVAFSCSEASDIFLNSLSIFYKLLMADKGRNEDAKYYVCIDLANGHMQMLLDEVRAIKQHWGKHVVIMTGNIANPESYRDYEEAGVDYCRIGIGGGGACVDGQTKILMADNNTESIKDINVGDYVMTLNGPQKVIGTFQKKVHKTLIINGNIECSDTHKFLAIRKSEYLDNMTEKEILQHAIYVEAKNLNNDYLLVGE